MSSLPELSEVLHILAPMEDRYFDLGIHLGIRIQQLKSIESNYPNISRRLTETISLWQENSTGECSWSMLAKAVERIGGHNRLAKELRERDVTNDLMEADSKPPQMHHPTERANGGYLSMSDSTQSRATRESEDESGYSSKSDSNQSGDSSGSEAECGCASKTSCSLCADECPNPATYRASVPILKEKSKAASQNEIPLKNSYFKDYNKSTNDTRKLQHLEDTGYSSRNDSAFGDSEIEHFDKVPGCGCDKPCSIYTLCAGKCPNPASTKVGVVRKRVQGQEVEDVLLPEEEGEEEDYAEKFEKETRQMRVQFAELVSDACDSLKRRNVATADLILFLQHASPLALKPRIDEMTKATCLAQVLTIVTGQTCSWFDYEMMTVLINRFGDDGDKERLKQYEVNFHRFAEQRLPNGKKHIEVGSGARVGGKQLVVKIDKEWDEVNFSDLKKIRGNLASLLNVRSRDLYLADIREGCIMMTFMITEELAGRLFPSRSCLTSSQTKTLKDEGVISLRCTKLSWRAARHMKPKIVPQNSLGWRFKMFDLRVMMAVMLFLASVLAGFSGACVLIFTQVGRLQINNNRTHAESDVFTLHNLQDNTTLNDSSLGSSDPPIAKSQSNWDRCPAYFPTKATKQRSITNYIDDERANHEDPSWKHLSKLDLIVHYHDEWSFKILKNATDARVDEVVLLSFPALNSSHNLHSHVTHQSNIHPTNISLCCQSPGHWFSNDGIQKHLMLCAPGKVNIIRALASLSHSIGDNISVPCNTEVGDNTAQTNCVLNIERSILCPDRNTSSPLFQYWHNIDPKITEAPEDVIIGLNPDGEGLMETATFECTALGRPSPEISITINPDGTLGMLKPLRGNNNDSAEDPTRCFQRTSTLTMAVTENDGGIIRCQADRSTSSYKNTRLGTLLRNSSITITLRGEIIYDIGLKVHINHQVTLNITYLDVDSGTYFGCDSQEIVPAECRKCQVIVSLTAKLGSQMVRGPSVTSSDVIDFEARTPQQTIEHLRTTTAISCAILVPIIGVGAIEIIIVVCCCLLGNRKKKEKQKEEQLKSDHKHEKETLKLKHKHEEDQLKSEHEHKEEQLESELEENVIDLGSKTDEVDRKEMIERIKKKLEELKEFMKEKAIQDDCPEDTPQVDLKPVDEFLEELLSKFKT